jgi:Zn-dependent protease with chaperone function
LLAIKNGAELMSNKPFAETWDFQSQNHQKEIRVNDTIEKGVTALASLWFLSKKPKIGRTGVIIGAVAAGLQYVGQKKIEGIKYQATKRLLDNSSPAPKNIQNIANRLFKKAGISQTAEIRIVDAPSVLSQNASNAQDPSQKPKVDASVIFETLAGKTANVGVFTIIDKEIVEDDKAVITIGKKVLDTLTEDEIAAVLAHETSHVKITQPGQNLTDSQKTYKYTSNNAISGITLGTLLTGSWKIMLPFMLASQGRNKALRKMIKLDEERADKNSIALFPNKTALKTALEKIHDLQLQDFGQNTQTPLQKSFAIHNSIEQRLVDIDKFYDEVSEFYNDNGYKLDTSDIIKPKSSPKTKRTRNKKPGQGPTAG